MKRNYIKVIFAFNCIAKRLWPLVANLLLLLLSDLLPRDWCLGGRPWNHRAWTRGRRETSKVAKSSYLDTAF